MSCVQERTPAMNKLVREDPYHFSSNLGGGKKGKTERQIIDLEFRNHITIDLKCKMKE